MGLEYNLLEKRELWITDLKLQNVNLTSLAAAAAGALNLSQSDVMVVDVRENWVTLDILCRSVRAEDIVGKQASLLAAITQVDGVTVTLETSVHSDGVLGMIALDTAETAQVLERTGQMTAQVREAVARRALIYPTGFELSQGLIEDTNSPYLQQELQFNGFLARIGPVLEDNRQKIALALQVAIDQGYGLVITTGGVGAEDKDHAVEALLQVDPQAATAYLVRYEKGQGRHVKDGVRIAVGRVGLTTIVTLPGPNDEVRIACPVLLSYLKEIEHNPQTLVDGLAEALRSVLIKKMVHHHHSGHSL